MNARMGLRIGTALAVVVLTFLALEKWMSEHDTPQALEWKAEYQASLWTPLQELSLTLADVGRALGEGRLWMISADSEPRLVSRYPLESDGQQWQVQAVIELDEQRMASLVQAQAWQPDAPDQSVSPAVLGALVGYPVERISLIPEQPLELNDIVGTFGPAEVRMPVSAGEVWIYSRQGVVVAVGKEQAHSIMFGLRGE